MAMCLATWCIEGRKCVYPDCPLQKEGACSTVTPKDWIDASGLYATIMMDFPDLAEKAFEALKNKQGEQGEQDEPKQTGH
jgi:hypothetical protein